MGNGGANMANTFNLTGIAGEHGELINPGSPSHAIPRTIPPRHPPYMLSMDARAGPMDGIASGPLLYPPLSGPVPTTPQVTHHFPGYQYGPPLPLASSPASQRANDPANRPPAVSLRPIMPSGNVNSKPPLSASLDSSAVMKQESEADRVRGSQRTPEVHATGVKREAAVMTGSTTKNGGVHAMNADGKYPCPHCSRTYLHTKHLKRHLFRHTGDRPYTCDLCKDTFTRSDIRNRHLQKCALRHGKLKAGSNSSQVRKKMAKGNGSPTDTPLADDLNHEPSSAGTNDQVDDFQTTPGIEEESNSPNDDQESICDPLSRNVSLKRRHSDVGGDKRTQVGPRPSGSNPASYDGSSNGSFVLPGSLGQDSVSMPYSNNGQYDSYLENFIFDEKLGDFGSLGSGIFETSAAPLGSGQSLQNPSGTSSAHGVDSNWAQFTPNSNREFVQGSSSSYATADQIPVSSASSLNQGIYESAAQHADEILNANGVWLPSVTSEHGKTPEMFGDAWGWHLEGYQLDPLRRKTEGLLAFCFPKDIPSTSNDDGDVEDLKRYMTADNISHFIELYTNFQGHWPIIHTPTFNLMEAYDGLLLCIICIGAVYSDRISLLQVRRLMDRVKQALERHSRIIGAQFHDGHHIAPRSLNDTTSWLEEVQAWILLCIIFTWHGTLSQREAARGVFPRIVSVARKAKMLQLSDSTGPCFSIFHHRQPAAEESEAANWDWLAWAEQEKRSRLMYIIWLMDAALALYFNCLPRLDSSEIRLPLPADDAAWDAPTATECANALGLHGVSAQRRNIAGSRRTRQLDLQTVVNALMHPTYELGPRSTNAYSKFIVIHVLHIQMWHAQRELAGNPNHHVSSSHGHESDGSDLHNLTTKEAQKVKVDSQSTAENINNAKSLSSDQMTSQAMGPRHMLKLTVNAFEKWKKIWDGDMAIQYPTSASSWRRFGFCRDAIHFYWLAQAFLRGNRVFDWEASPDTRLMQVLGLLKKVKRWVSTSAQRGEEIGSVGDIDESYGVEELTLDMKLLFRPRNEQTDHPVPGVQTDILNIFS